jgi:hypothetical protein
MRPETKDTSYPLFGKVSTPRMIIAQFDVLNQLRVLNPLRQSVLNTLETMLAGGPRQFFSAYLAVFILLHQVSVLSADRYRHGTANLASV